MPGKGESAVPLCYHCFRETNTPGPCPHCGYDGAAAAEKYPLSLKLGAILNGRYVIGRVLGQGGYGITYIALDDRTQRRLAIKEYFPTDFAGRASDGCTVQLLSRDRQENFEYGKGQFLEEAKTLAAFIGNEHIVRVHSYFEENGTAYFTMEYVDGLPLDKYMATKGGRLSVEEASRLLLPLMDALSTVHEKGIVHRDIAPDNIIIEKTGGAKLIDFGAARYSTGEKSKSLDVVIKHGFAPKEQYTRRGRQGPWTDVYAMAATFYYAITGKVPPEAIDRIDEDDLVAPSVLGVKISDGAEDALFKALEVSQRERYQSMADFHRALQAAVADELRAAQEDARHEANYRAAAALMEVSDLLSLRNAEAIFASLGAYRDAPRLAAECAQRIAAIEAAERAEQERRAREEAERVLRAREEEERLAREEASRLRREREEAERKAREEAEHIKQEKAEKERLAREAAERAREEKEERERKAREEAERLKREQKAREAAERARQKQAAREAKEKAKQEKAKTAGKAKKLRPAQIALAALLVLGGVFFAVRSGKDAHAAVPVEEAPQAEAEESVEETPQPAVEWTEGTVSFSLTDDVLVISGTGTIPQTTRGEAKAAREIHIENGVTEIGPYAFASFSSLERVSIPESVTSIGNDAFRNCKNLSSVSIPDGVTSIQDYAFYGCISLSGVTIPDGVTSIESGAFSHCTNLSHVTIPESVRSIGDNAFDGCSSLSSVSIPSSVTRIGYQMFFNCTGLSSVTIPDSVTIIGTYAFYGCGRLKDIYYAGSETQWSTVTIRSAAIPNSVTVHFGA